MFFLKKISAFRKFFVTLYDFVATRSKAHVGQTLCVCATDISLSPFTNNACTARTHSVPIHARCNKVVGSWQLVNENKYL